MAKPYLSTPSASGGGGFKVVQNSGDYERGDGDALYNTFGGAGDRKKFTLSFWLKRESTAASGAVLGANFVYVDTGGGYPTTEFGFTSGLDTITLQSRSGAGSYNYQKVTTPSYTSTAAWYHFVIVSDTDNVTAEDRVRLYVNGVRVTSWGTNTLPSSGFQGAWGAAQQHFFGARNTSGADCLDGLVAEVYHVNGLALEPTEFADDNGGVWTPKTYSGAFGTNGFLFEFLNSGAVGTDTSGNGNNFTNSGVVQSATVPPVG